MLSRMINLNNQTNNQINKQTNNQINKQTNNQTNTIQQKINVVNVVNIADFINTEDKQCSIKLRFQLDNGYYDYLFIDSINVSDYVKIRYYLVLLSSIGIDEADNIATVHVNDYKIASLGLFYWFNVLSKRIDINTMQPFIIEANSKKITLTDIYVFYRDRCIDYIEVDATR